MLKCVLAQVCLIVELIYINCCSGCLFCPSCQLQRSPVKACQRRQTSVERTMALLSRHQQRHCRHSRHLYVVKAACRGCRHRAHTWLAELVCTSSHRPLNIHCRQPTPVWPQQWTSAELWLQPAVSVCIVMRPGHLQLKLRHPVSHHSLTVQMVCFCLHLTYNLVFMSISVSFNEHEIYRHVTCVNCMAISERSLVCCDWETPGLLCCKLLVKYVEMGTAFVQCGIESVNWLQKFHSLNGT